MGSKENQGNRENGDDGLCDTKPESSQVCYGLGMRTLCAGIEEELSTRSALAAFVARLESRDSVPGHNSCRRERRNWRSKNHTHRRGHPLCVAEAAVTAVTTVADVATWC